jgi:hypothetical protein
MHPSVTCIQVCLAPKRFRIAIPCYPNAPFSFVFTESMQRLQNVALALSAKTNSANDGVEQEIPNEAKKNSQNVKHFSLKGFAGFLPISKIRGRLSLDSSADQQ